MYRREKEIIRKSNARAKTMILFRCCCVQAGNKHTCLRKVETNRMNWIPPFAISFVPSYIKCPIPCSLVPDLNWLPPSLLKAHNFFYATFPSISISNWKTKNHLRSAHSTASYSITATNCFVCFVSQIVRHKRSGMCACLFFRSRSLQNACKSHVNHSSVILFDLLISETRSLNIWCVFFSSILPCQMGFCFMIIRKK